jgi:hypothetical protein
MLHFNWEYHYISESLGKIVTQIPLLFIIIVLAEIHMPLLFVIIVFDVIIGLL